jgi:hypothetical protein
VAPHGDPAKDLSARRPDACYGGGSHRLAPPPRHCSETAVSEDQQADSFAARLYAGGANTVAPASPHPGFQDFQHGLMAGFSHPGKAPLLLNNLHSCFSQPV